MTRPTALTATFLLPIFATAAAAGDAAPARAGVCEIVDRSNVVALLACPENLAPQALREAGVAACNMYAKCHAWIWTDRSKIPPKAPAVQTGLPEPVRASAVALWDNGTQSLVLLRRKSR